jgi:hypothetical protein
MVKINANFAEVYGLIDAIDVGGGGGGGGITDVESDTSPTLGGNLALGGFTVGDATAADLTKLHAITASATEINYLVGVTSLLQVQLDALAEDSGDPSTGATAIAFFNPDARFGDAANVQEALDYGWAHFLDNTDAEDPEVATALVSGDQVLVFGIDGSIKMIEWSIIIGDGSNGVVHTSESNYNISVADVRRTIVFNSGSACTCTLPLQADEEFVAGNYIDVIQNGAGLLTIVCDSGTIILNGASGGEVESTGRNATIRLKNIGVDTWNASGASAVNTEPADIVAPTIVSINPANGSTISADQIIQITFSEPVVVGTGNITQRHDSGGGYSDDGTVDVTASQGLDPGEMTIVDTVLYLPPITTRVEGNDYAYRIAATAFDDVAGNSFAGVADDTTIHFDIAESASSEIEVVDSGSWYIDPGTVVGANQTKTMSSTPLTGDMVIYGAVCRDDIGAVPAGASIMDRSTSANPGCYIYCRTEGGTPSNTITFPTKSTRRQAAWYAIVRGTGGTLTVSGGAGTGNASNVLPANAPAYAQLTADELRFAVGMIENYDLTPTVTDIEGAGWDNIISQNTGQASSSVGATVLVAIYPEGGSVSTSVDPPAWGTGVCNWYSQHFGIKEV